MKKLLLKIKNRIIIFIIGKKMINDIFLLQLPDKYTFDMGVYHNPYNCKMCFIALIHKSGIKFEEALDRIPFFKIENIRHIHDSRWVYFDNDLQNAKARFRYFVKNAEFLDVEDFITTVPAETKIIGKRGYLIEQYRKVIKPYL